MSETCSEVAGVFLKLLPGELKQYVAKDHPVILRVPAASPEVGELLVYDNGIELTVVVGRIDHWHFMPYCEAGTESERQRKAADQAVHRIKDILAERVRFRNELKGGRVVAGSSWDPEYQDGGPLLKMTDEFREYTWSGEKVHRRTSPLMRWLRGLVSRKSSTDTPQSRTCTLRP